MSIEEKLAANQKRGLKFSGIGVNDAKPVKAKKEKNVTEAIKELNTGIDLSQIDERSVE